jgi:hypothetical protein
MPNYKTIQTRTSDNSIIKPSELIDVVELSPLKLADRRIYNWLIGNAWDQIDQDVEHSIEKRDLRGTHTGTDRLDDSIGRLMSARVRVKLERDGVPYIRSFNLLDHVDEPVRKDGLIYYKFPAKLRAIIQDSSIFARLQKDVMLSLSSKYALALYEVLQKRRNLKHQWSETFQLDQMRALLGVPDDKLAAYRDFKRRALVPAIDEVSGLADYGIKFAEVKKGRAVVAITISWWRKNEDELKLAFQELRRPRVGRKARLSGKAENTVLKTL